MSLDLYTNFSQESKLAKRYLQDTKINFQEMFVGQELPELLLPSRGIFEEPKVLTNFASPFNEPIIPSLFENSIGPGIPVAYYSFSGVKCFIRYSIIFERMKPSLKGRSKLYMTDIQTFYPRKGGKLVTCFNEHKEKIFQGPIGQAPNNFEKILDSHSYKDWHDVSSREIGDLEELVKKQNENGFLLDEQTFTVVFPDEIEKLRQGKIIPIQNYCSIYEATFEAYYLDKGCVFGLYAHMID